MAIKKVQIVPPGYTDIFHPETDSTVVLMGDSTSLQATYTDIINGVISVGNALKVNNKTVAKDVPVDANFTNTITTINGKTGAITKEDIVALGIPASDTNTITTINGKTGAITKEDIVALGIPASDTNTVYTHPTTAGNKHIPTGGLANQYLKYSASGTAVWETPVKADVGLGSVDTNKQMPIAGGTFTGVVVAQSNTSYTTRQLRNVILSTSNAVLASMQDGDIWIKYE